MQRENVDRAVSRYSSLFTLPSGRSIAAFLCLESMIAGVAVGLPYDMSLNGLTLGATVGILVFFSTLLADILNAKVLLSRDLILNQRRCTFLSLASNLFVLSSAFIASLISFSISDPNIWFKVTSVGLYACLSLRFLVFYSLSFLGSLKIFFSAMLQPVLLLLSLLTFLFPFSWLGAAVYFLLYYSLAVLAAFSGVYFFIKSLDTVSVKTLGIPSIRMFKAFLANWTEDLESPFEEVLEQLSEERKVEFTLIGFKTGTKMKAVIVVPTIHPGPFKNVGSSPLPNLIQKALEDKLGCAVSVPHGISGHELDLSSQAQNEKVINQILAASEFQFYDPYATPFVSVREDDAMAGCQIFGGCALVTLTLAPQTMEDLPFELNNFANQEAKRNGLDCAVAIDAHNSFQGSFDLRKVTGTIEKTIVAVLKKAATSPRSQFEMGAAKVIPREFGLKEGIGPGGISVVVTKVADNITAYVTIDGNNMVSGLREKILSSLVDLGVNSGEILTTDTHVVNAIVMADRGYHPIGEVIDHDQLIDYVKKAVAMALDNLEPAETSWHKEDIQKVNVIGERQIENLCLVVDQTARKAKKTSAIIFPAIGFFLSVLLMML